MRRYFGLLSLAGMAILAAAPRAQAATIFDATLTGGVESPPTSSTASGTAMFTLSTDLTTLTVDSLTFSGLTTPDIAAHLHCCAGVNVAAPVVLSFVNAGFPLGVTSGTYTHTFTLATALTGITPLAFVTGLEAGDVYFNIHTSTFPGGEIRGQLEIVPEPGAGALMLAGLLAVPLGLRRRGHRRA